MNEQQQKTLLSSWRQSSLFRVAAAYVFGSWVLLQLAEIVLPSYDVPNLVMQALIATLFLLFPVVILLEHFTNLSNIFLGTAKSPDASENTDEILSLQAASVVPVTMVERRRITTLACSVRGVRNEKDDPELMVGVVAGIEAEIQEIVDRYEGLRLLSSQNEIVVAFGYPRLHEDDARRAVKASIELNQLVYAQDKDDDPTTFILGRIGLHTATVVIDDADGLADPLALLGDCKAVAEWLQAAAPENGAAACSETTDQIKASFNVDELAKLSHPRLGNKVPVYAIGSELDAQAQQLHKSGGELIGRDHELGMLMDRWQSVVEGDGQFVLLKGEPGIGKSTLMHHAVRKMVEQNSPLLLLANCESYFQATPLRPIVSLFEKMALGDDLSTSDPDRLEGLRNFLEPLVIDKNYALPILVSLLSIKTDDPALLLNDSGQKLREKTLTLLVNLLQVLSQDQPVLLVLEDIHWADPSTRDFINRLLVDCQSDRILCFFTARPEIESWESASNLVTIEVQRLSGKMTDMLVQEYLGNVSIPEKLREQIVRDGAGVPFYVEELVRGLMERPSSSGKAESLQLPTTLQAVLSARLDQLGSSKPLLQLCAVVGHEFSYQLLREIVRVDDDVLLNKVLADLVARGMLYQRGSIPEATFSFQHGLLMDAAYQSLTTKTRSELHGTIGDVIERSFPELCHNTPVRLAQHFTYAGLGEKAIGYRIVATRHAVQHFSTDEALTQISSGLEALVLVEDAEQKKFLEMTLHNLNGSVLLASRGYTSPEVRTSFETALALSNSVDHSPELFQMIVGLWMYYLIKGNYKQAEELGHRLLALAKEKGGGPELLQAYYCLGYSIYQTGAIGACIKYYEQAIALEKPGEDYARQTPSHDDTRVHLHCMYAHALWMAGYSEKALQEAEGAIQLAIDINQPYAEVWARYQISSFYHQRSDFTKMESTLSRALEIATEKGFNFFIPLCIYFRSSQIKNLNERVVSMVEHHEMTMQTGARSGSTHLKSLLVESLIDLGEHRRAGVRMDEIRELMEQNNENLWQSEFVRLETKLDLSLGKIDTALAEERLTDSVGLSLEMGNLPFALRSALALHTIASDKTAALENLKSVLDSYPTGDSTEEFRRAEQMVSQK
ncbi:MAG: class 3 adenylate cyclase/tetratricopeptide (TPR) repeat protein [Candidatus Azotimanducaceae bacterium]|jgi:class 3 adenylate cyclase/tetratricopeptide (TPR) repeat protein